MEDPTRMRGVVPGSWEAGLNWGGMSSTRKDEGCSAGITKGLTSRNEEKKAGKNN